MLIRKYFPEILIFFLLLVFPILEGFFIELNVILPFIFVFPLTIILTKRKIRKDKIFWLFSVFLAIGSISTLFSQSPVRSLINLMLYFFYFIIFLVVRDAISNKKIFEEIFTIVVLVNSITLCLLSFYFLIFNQNFLRGAMSLVFANSGHNHLVDFLIFGFPISLTLYYHEKQKAKKILFLIINLVFLNGFIFSFSRGGILMAILEIVFLSLLFFGSKKFKGTKMSINYSFSLVAGLILFLILALSFFSRFIKVGQFDDFFLRKTFRQMSFTSRFEYWRQALLGFKENFLIGTGLDTFRFISWKFQRKASGWSWYTHNHFFELFLETGIFGGFTFLILIFLILRKIKPLVNFSSIGLKTGLFASLVHSFFDYDWQFVSIFSIFWIISALLLNQNKEKEPILKSKLFYASLTTFSFFIFIFGLLMLRSEFLLFKGLSVYEKDKNRGLKYFTASNKILVFSPKKTREIAEYVFDDGDNLSALSIVQKSLVFEKADWKTYQFLGDVCLILNKQDQAINYYQKAISLNLIDSVDSYFNLVKIYDKMGDDEKQKKVLLDFFGKTETVKNFIYFSPERRDELFQIFLKYIKKDPQFAIIILEKSEQFVGKKMFDVFSWEQKMVILENLKDFQDEEIKDLVDKRKARYFFWLSALAIYDDQDENLYNIENWLKKAIVFDNSRGEYKEYLNAIVTFKEAKKDIYERNFDIARIKLNKLIKNASQEDLETMAYYQRIFYARIFDWLGRSCQEEDWGKAQENWQKALELDPGNETYRLKVAN